MKHFTFYEKIILEGIDLEAYNLNNDCYLYDKVKTLYNIFVSEYGYNIKRYGKQRAFKEWLMGLPSAIHTPFYNYDILTLAKEANILVNPTEEQEDLFLAQYWDNLSTAYFVLYDNL